jgi:hypothetical protein
MTGRYSRRGPNCRSELGKLLVEEPSEPGLALTVVQDIADPHEGRLFP